MVDILITIPNNKVSEFKLGFLKAYPLEEGLTELQHIKKYIRSQLINMYKTGKMQIARETTPESIDETVVTE